MAKQNFLNGGYIGKLGNTVGQRWKDKKIIRTYVVPANPNTPAQQTARQQFATANKLAQQAMTINGHTGVWDTSTKPEYSQRVGQAMRRLRLGYSEQDSLPLYPEGQSPSIGLSINAVSYDPAAQKYTFATQGFGINNPLAAEITFYTPLNYSGGKYNENIIHATVDAPAGTFSVDLSTTNQTDGQTVKSLFDDAIQLGFYAMKATFFDALGSTLSNISIARKYKVDNKLYDFDESLTMLNSTQKVTFTAAFSQSRIQGSISPFQSAGFPIIYRVSTENQYYGGFVAETAESSFVQMNSNADAAFTVPVSPASGYLQETEAVTYGLTFGATQPQITKDVSTATYQLPSLALSINNVTYAANTQKYTFTTQGFGFNEPTTAEISFYTPLDYSGGKYNENIIHATVDAPAGTFSVDLSATNQTDQQAVKTLFKNAIQLGFCAMKATFFDAQNAVLSNISIAEKYQVANKLYDFDETYTMAITTQKVTFTRAFSQNRMQGSISPFQTSGFPIVYRVSVENQYYGGIAGETVESSFVQMDANQAASFTIPVTPASGDLLETTATSYGLQTVSNRPRITKDTSTATYQLPIVETKITDITFTGNTIRFDLDQNIKNFYAESGTVTITYKDLSKWPAMTNSTITQKLNIGNSGRYFAITNADVPKLGGVILGSLEITFTDNAGDPIAGLAPDKTVNVANKYYYSNLQNSLTVTQTASIVSGKAISGAVKASFKATAVPPVACVYQNALIVTYKGNVTEFFLVSGIRTSITASQNITVNTTTYADEEIIKMEVITLAVASSSANASAGWTSATASVPTSFTLPKLLYDSGTGEISFTLPTGIPSYLGRIGGRWRAWESGRKSLKAATIPTEIIPENRTIILESSGLGADSLDYGAPLFMQLQLFYEDNTASSTTQLVIPLPPDNEPELVMPYGAVATKTASTATVNAQSSGDFTITFGNNVFITPYQPCIAAAYTWYDENGSEVLEGASEIETDALDEAHGIADAVYQAGTNISLERNGNLLLWYYEDDVMNLVAVV